MDPAQLKANLSAVRNRISDACRRAGRSPAEVKLIGVTKGVDVETIRCACSLGLSDCGENRVQEASRKIPSLHDLDPRPGFRMIGHLQSNKIKTCLDLFDSLDSLDSLDLARDLDRRVVRRFPVLLQVKLAPEPGKSGFSEAGLKYEFAAIRALPNLDVRGLMMIAPLAHDPESLRPLFRRLKSLAGELGLAELSMGMSNDFAVAIEEGSTMVRIGRAIFGEREMT